MWKPEVSAYEFPGSNLGRYSSMHLAQTCPSLTTFVESPMEQVNAFNDYRKQSNGPFSESYNLGW